MAEANERSHLADDDDLTSPFTNIFVGPFEDTEQANLLFSASVGHMSGLQKALLELAPGVSVDQLQLIASAQVRLNRDVHVDDLMPLVRACKDMGIGMHVQQIAIPGQDPSRGEWYWRPEMVDEVPIERHFTPDALIFSDAQAAAVRAWVDDELAADRMLAAYKGHLPGLRQRIDAQAAAQIQLAQEVSWRVWPASPAARRPALASLESVAASRGVSPVSLLLDDTDI